MNTVTIAWSAVAGAALAMAGAHGALWLLNRRARASLAFCVVALAVCGLAITELGMMHSASAAEFGWWARWFHLPNFFAVVGLVAYVHLEFGTGRAWLAGLIVALRTLLLGLNLVLEPNVNWSQISALHTISFLGEPVSVVGSAVVRLPAQWIGTLSSLLLIAYVADALASAWRRRDAETRRKSAVVCGGILAFVTLAILESQLVVWGVLRMPVVIAPLFLILVAAVTYETSRAIVAAVRMEREAARLRDELAHVSRVNMVGQLSSALAHELTQPLTSILADAQAARMMLEDGKVDLPELLAILTDICAADRRADEIVQRVRAFMKRGRSELRPVSLEAVAHEVLALVQTEAAAQRIALEISMPERLPPVRADRVQLAQVLLNLVVNAMDSVASGRAAERKVRIEARHDAGHVEVAVVDSGIGIADDLFPRLFDAFVTTKQAGLGLGLALSKSIVQAHGGDLQASNNAGGGATLRFTLGTDLPQPEIAEAAPDRFLTTRDDAR
jgi:signal transduction histidine kinase